MKSVHDLPFLDWFWLLAIVALTVGCSLSKIIQVYSLLSDGNSSVFVAICCVIFPNEAHNFNLSSTLGFTGNSTC